MSSRFQDALIIAAISDRCDQHAIDIQVDHYKITEICDSPYD
jgi:hypothetical protein